MKSKLKIYTSYVSPMTLDAIVKHNILPIFIIRSIHNSQLIGQYSDTSIHFKDLAPQTELFRARRDGLISDLEFDKRYIIEMSRINFQDTIKRLDYLASLCGASGVALLGYGNDYSKCHRRLLSELLNSSGLLENNIKELII